MPGINRYKSKFNTISKAIMALAVCLLSAPAMMANGGGSAPKESSVNDPFVITMIIIMIILLLIIVLLSNVLIGASGYYWQKKKESEKEKSGVITGLSVIGLLLFAVPSFARDGGVAAEAVQASNGLGGLSTVAYYAIVGVIGIELLVIFTLLYQLRTFLAKEKRLHIEAAGNTGKLRIAAVWHKMNKFRPAEQETQIQLDHEYDGIRELDNRLPPWWLYGFYVSIIFAGIYLWRYHVSHTAPLSGEELQIAMKQAEEQKAIYLKKSANNVDENTVKLLSDATDIAGGEKVFAQNCAACHGKAGEGIVGPNLTDDYWLHGGSIKDVFKSIKYGWPEKGMRSWKEDLSPVQLAQVTSYIKSIHGTNPPNAKAKQGELYQEATGNKSDSLNNKVAIVTEK